MNMAITSFKQLAVNLQSVNIDAELCRKIAAVDDLLEALDELDSLFDSFNDCGGSETTGAYLSGAGFNAIKNVRVAIQLVKFTDS